MNSEITSTNLNHLEEKTNLQETIDELDADNEALSSTVTNLNSQITDLHSEIADLNQEVADCANQAPISTTNAPPMRYTADQCEVSLIYFTFQRNCTN